MMTTVDAWSTVPSLPSTVAQFRRKIMSSQNQEFTEGPQVYRPGGFHPVYLGEVYNGKYEVLRKLGSGRYSTVWLVQNREECNFRALKILSAECYGGLKDTYEREILEHLRDADPSHPGYAYISTLVDSFEHQGPNGRHVCLVFRVMGETLRSFGTWFEHHMIPNEIMRRFTIQLLLALDYAHDHNVIHTDIKPDNIFVQIQDESLISKLYLPNNPADPAGFDTSTNPSSIQCQPLKWDYFQNGANLLEFDIALGDWGVASWTHSHLTELIQPVALRAPEVLIKAPWGPSTDLWNLGAVILEVFRAVRMFSGRVPPDGHYEVRSHLHEIVDLFGPFPKSLLQKGDQELVQEYFDSAGKVKHLPPLDRPGLESEAFLGKLDRKNKRQFVIFLRSLMKVDPEERKTTMELLAEPWLDAVRA
ncbi:CMGC/SRPK protein kinase [Coccidioides immitis RS]|uniref:non-specific serine/threonine protein kinase n=1 Tax=Coccidioides immitis (strain RS) TaxID=246410 RepID=J3KAB6_COCIM|nr:CMGC/SRPK protein kinase [Coccidioides immitis RS]EAS31948.3 CMGC/SRPK protein kinase [Coccidioides immitis RS]